MSRLRSEGGVARHVRSRGDLLLVGFFSCWLFVFAAGAGASEERSTGPASERYKAGFLRQAILGSGYRELWEAPVDLPILDLQGEGGGLVPTRRFGGLQTAVLGFKGADGRLYSFRGTDKNPAKVLDPLLQGTIVEWVVQEQMAAQHPGGPLVAGALTEVAGVLTVAERMVVMPDDPLLGEFREEFAGLIGTFFVYPQPGKDDAKGFYGATEIIGHKELYQRLESANDDRVDVEAFLRARLMDLLLGDFDRHRKQWRWAMIPGNPDWQPIPEDRDIAFVRYNGIGPRLMSVYIPILQLYGPDYPRSIKGLTLHGWEQDRWLLPHLSWSQWLPVIEAIQSDLTDDVIAQAVAALPAGYEERSGADLQTSIRGRRDALKVGARRFYDHLAKEVDIQTSNASDQIQIDRLEGGGVVVEVRDQVDSGRLLYRRAFDPDETREVRLYLRGGADRVETSGVGCRVAARLTKSCVLLRVIAAGGSKTIDDRAIGGTRVYDPESTAEVLAGPGTEVSRRPYTPPESDAGFVDVENVPPRDWGSDTVPVPEIGFEPDIGVLLGISASHTRYGFRKHPWSSKHSIGVSFATEPEEFGARYRGRWRFENSDTVAAFDLRYSGYDVLNFFGFGNNTTNNISIRKLRISNEQFKASPSITRSFWEDAVSIRGGVDFQLSRTDIEDGDQPEPGVPNPPFVAEFLDPVTGDDYGVRDFLLLAPTVRLQFDTRESVHYEQTNLELPFNDNPAAGYPTSGFYFELEGKVAPPLLDVRSVYGVVGGSVSGYISAGENAWATLGVRLGGKTTFGRTPFFDQAELGGGRFLSGLTNNRGFLSRRFLGDHSAYGNADLRIVLARLKLIVPGDIGLLGFFDVGRVFADGDAENSREWHTSGGGGIWFAPLVRTNAVSFTVAESAERTLFYLRFGFHY